MSQNINSIGLEHLMKAASALTELTEADSKLIIGKQEERVPISDDDTASATASSLAPSSSTVLTSNSATTISTNNSVSCNSSTTTTGGSARPASAPLPNSRDIFPQRLMRILSDKDVHHIITWLPHGRAFVIVEPEELAEKVLPKHFPESCTSGNQKCKYPSFTRKLNRWGFRQVTRGPDAGAFHHGLFLRDAPQLCLQMICQRTRRRNDKNHVVYQDQQQQQQQQQQYGNQTYAPSVHNPTLLNNHVNNSNTTTMITNTTSNNNSSSGNNNNNQFFPMNHGGPMSFPHIQAYANHPYYGTLPNMAAVTARTAVNTTSTSTGPNNIHGNHSNPTTGMNPPPLGVSATSIHPAQNNKQQHLAHLATASTMPSLMHITPPSSSSSSSSSANINLNGSNLMNAATFTSANTPSPFATAMLMTNNNINSNVMTNSHSNSGSATGITTTTPTPSTSQILNQNLPQNFYGNHTISNYPPNLKNTLQGVVNTNPPNATMTMATRTLVNAESDHNPAPVILATSAATADASALNAVSDANATSMSNSATASTTTTSTADDNPDKEKKSDSNEKRIANAKNMLYDAYLKALG